MEIEKLVKALRCETRNYMACANCRYATWKNCGVICEWEKMQLDAADALTAQQKDIADLRNELCLKCGRYHEAHNGACEGCRWRTKE